jgi:lipopolysaccharide/colanic/teichoic acid biosynthesis glycosyltransferase
VPHSKRAFDIVFAAIGLVVSMPILMLAALAIWIEDGLPVFFKQSRLGRNGKIFRIYKFRKFRKTTLDQSVVVTLPDDKRYSRIGKILDKLKINELPQLVNILRGEMSIVGPRPEIPDFYHCFAGSHARLLNFTPGLFGPSQTLFRNEAEMYSEHQDPLTLYVKVIFPQKAELDLQYYDTATLSSDILWVFKSVASVLRGSKRQLLPATRLKEEQRGLK